MDQTRFDIVTHVFAGSPSRRDVLRGLIGAGLSIVSHQVYDDAEAKKHRKHRKKKQKNKTPTSPEPVFNEFGCLAVAQPCRGDNTLCCSGVCQGTAPAANEPDTSRCIAHDAGTCQQEGTGICLSDETRNISCNNNASCRCFTTTAASNVCATFQGDRSCSTCQRDADCVALGFPPGSACAPFSQGFCGGLCPSGMACVIPCGIELPPEM
jgi:hypothetical protein